MRTSLFNLDQEDGQLYYISQGAAHFGQLPHFMAARPCKHYWMCLGHMLGGGVGFVGGKGSGWGPASGGVVSDD